jgi:hypothetical protein
MPDPNIALNVPPTILDLVQRGLVERFFYDGLFQALLFRAEAQQEEFQGNIGETTLSTRAGIPDPITKPIAPGQDPQPRTGVFEQWETTLLRYADATDVNMPTAAVASADIFLRSIQTLGMGSGLSLNRIPRNALFTAYLSGQTTLIGAVGAADLTAHVSALNGFTKVLTKGTNVAPVPVSTSAPLAITIGGIATTVVGTAPDDANVPLGPGTLTLGVALGGGGAAARASVLSVARPLISRVGGGTNIDAIGLNDVVQMQDIINGVNKLRNANVFPHEDGTYHVHISTTFNGQVFTDPAWQRQMNQGVNNNPQYQQAFLGSFAGCSFYLNNECPDDANSGALVATGTNAKYAEDINAEVVNESGVRIGRSIMTGRGAIFERWLDEKRFVSEAGITGKLAQFAVTNQGIAVMTERITLIMRSPINRLQDQVGLAWSYSGAFPIPSDITSGGPQLFKRALVLEHALDA